MRKVFCVMLAAAMFAGCGTSVPLPSPSNEAPSPIKTQISTPSIAPIKTPPPMPSLTPSEEPAIDLISSTPVTASPVPLRTITDFEPGRALGNLVTTDGKYLYYDCIFEFDNSEDDYASIVRFDPETRATEEIRRIPGMGGIIQIFTDSGGNLYYVMNYDTDPITGEDVNRLSRYDPAGDIILARDVNWVSHVDSRYIIYTTNTDYYNDIDRLYVLDLQSGSIAELQNKVDFDSLDYGESRISIRHENSQIKVQIRDFKSGKTSLFSVAADKLGLSEQHELDIEYLVRAFSEGNRLALLVYPESGLNKGTFYLIDIIKNKIISQKTLDRTVERSATIFHQGKVIFYSYVEKDEMNLGPKIQSYSLKDGSIRTIKNFPDTGWEDGLYFEIIDNFLWYGYYSHGDGTRYWGTDYISLN